MKFVAEQRMYPGPGTDFIARKGMYFREPRHIFPIAYLQSTRWVGPHCAFAHYHPLATNRERELHPLAQTAVTGDTARLCSRVNQLANASG